MPTDPNNQAVDNLHLAISKGYRFRLRLIEAHITNLAIRQPDAILQALVSKAGEVGAGIDPNHLPHPPVSEDAGFLETVLEGDAVKLREATPSDTAEDLVRKLVKVITFLVKEGDNYRSAKG